MLRLLPLLLLAAPLTAADTAPEPKRLPDTSGFPKAVAAALGGEHFEYLGGEPGRITTSIGTAHAERFWYAKVRAKRPGLYLFSYTIRFAYPAHVTKNWLTATDAEYTLRIAVGKAGAPRVFTPGGFGGSAFPHANAGDTLLIPVHTDPFRIDHRFAPLKVVGPDDPVFGVIGGRTDAYYLKNAADPPPVANTAKHAKLLGCWVGSGGNRPGTATSHTHGAYLELTTHGTFNLTGRLADAKADEGFAFRVLPKDRPATVVIESIGYVEGCEKFSSHSTSGVGCGTLEARVGDRVFLYAGGYSTPGLSGPDPTKSGVVEERPFRDVRPYEPR